MREANTLIKSFDSISAFWRPWSDLPSLAPLKSGLEYTAVGPAFRADFLHY
jgi:hypothetical protein